MTFRLAAQEWMLEGDTLEDKFAFARSVGFDGIELGARGAGVFEGRASELTRASAAGVIMPSAVVLPTSFLGDFDPDRRRQAIDELSGFLRILPAAGAAGIVCPNGFGVFSTKLPPFDPPRPASDSRALLVEALRAALTASADVHTAIYLEPLNRYEDYLVNTLADAASVVDEVGDPRVQVIADTFHMSIEEVDLGRAIRDCGARIAHVQLGDTNRLEPGAGHYDWDETLTALEDIGYDGWLAMECGLSGSARDVLPRVAGILKR
ncbi:MAG: sugar phosphate isomerase/epimerase family protein [Pseudolysinimonas sp.]